MKVIVNFGEKKVLVPCGTSGDLLIRELIQMAIVKYCKLSANHHQNLNLNSDQVQLRLNNGAVVDPDDRIVDVVDDREELFAVIDSPSAISALELTSSMTSSNISSSLSEHERSANRPSSNNRHEVIVTDADLRARSLRVKSEVNDEIPKTTNRNGMQNAQIDDQTGDLMFSVYLAKESSPLGIHVIPFNNQNEEQVHGLVVQTVEPDGRIQRQGILQINDRITEINRNNIEQCSFEKAQQIFRNALLESELELRVVRSGKKGSFFLNQTNSINEFVQNNKRLGKVLKISLTKGSDGLGFKLASRDNPTGSVNPIYVKSIFAKGAAVDDGRLKTGDRLLMVNGIDVTQMSLQDAVSLLRETRVGETIHLCVSRQQDGSLPRDFVAEDKKSQILTFDIPLRDTSSAGLGITLKGKTSIVDGASIDLGIFVKSILTGGAAHRDNRLRSNDQILVINDFSLVNLSNVDAANILHDAVRKEIHPGYIKITVSRSQQQDLDTSSISFQTKNVQETDLLPPMQSNDENELDLTNFVPQVTRRSSTHEFKTPKPIDSEIRAPSRDRTTNSEKKNQDENQSEAVNPFERETAFRQSISEKRRLNQQANKQAVQWKQQSFHEDRSSSIEKRNPLRGVLDSNNNIPLTLNRSSSFESVSRSNEGKTSNDEQKRQAKLRNRAWNESFRQAVDKSYGQTATQQNGNETNGNEKSLKNRFKFSNFFLRSKRKDQQDEKSLKYSSVIDEPSANIYPPPPAPFSSHHDRYEPHRFESKTNFNTSNDRLIESKIVSGKSSVSIHPVVARPNVSANLNGSHSLKYQTKTGRPTLMIPTSSSSVEVPIQRNFYPNSHCYLPFESPANV